MLESVQIVLFRIGAKTIIFRKFSPLSPLPRLFAIKNRLFSQIFHPDFHRFLAAGHPIHWPQAYVCVKQ
jgi:hypothetical protein